jgi:serine protease inhibitor
MLREECPTVFGTGADLSAMTEGANDWYLSSVSQGCVFKVDEEGAEAAAAVVAVVRARCIVRLPTFVGDRPFAFFVHAPNGTPLFAGTFEGE